MEKREREISRITDLIYRFLNTIYQRSKERGRYKKKKNLEEFSFRSSAKPFLAGGSNERQFLGEEIPGRGGTLLSRGRCIT